QYLNCAGRPNASTKLSSAGGSETPGNLLPVHQLVEEVRQVGGALVAEVDVVGMLPHVDAQQGLLAEAQRVHAVLGLGDLQAAIAVLHQPGPARAELARAGGGEFFLELV